MARFQPGDATVVVEGVKTPEADTDAANKAYVDANGGGGDDITASGGLQRVGDDISIATDGVTSDKIATNAVTSDAIAQHAVTTFEIAPEAVDEVRLDATNTPTAGQLLSATGSNDQFTWVDASEGEAITASGGLQRIDNDISIATGGVDTTQLAAGAVDTNRLADDAVSSAKIADIAVKEEHLDATNDPTTGQVLTSATDTNQFTWSTIPESITSIVNGGHIDVSTEDGVATLTFDETYDLWNGKTDWNLITSGTPSGDNILWDEATSTLSVPSLAGRSILEILLDARSGMAVHIRQENTTSSPSGFQSGFYQILDINAVDTPSDLVTIRLLPDRSDIFSETEGNTYQYELSILQFVTGGTLDNLTLNALADVDVSTLPTDGQVLAFDTSSGSYIPADNAGGGGQPASDYNNAVLGALSDPNISYSYTTETTPVNEGDVSISTADSPSTGYELIFRKSDVSTKFLQSLSLLQIGFGSPISFATYAVSTISFSLSVDPELVTINLVNGPLGGTDILASLPSDDTAVSISVSSYEFDNPDLGDLTDVDLSTDPTDGQVLAYELSSDTWKAADAGSGGGGDLGDLGDVNTSGVQDGFILRYDADNLNYRVHSVGDTNRAYGGLDVDMDTGFTVPAATGFHAVSVGSNAVASGVEAVAIGAETDAVAQGAVAIGNEAQASFASSTALGENADAAHTNSTAIGTGAVTTEVDEVRLGDANAHTTVNPSVAGNESEDNQLVSKRWVNNQISDASRVISSTANALENLTIVTASTPWDDYRIVPVDSIDDPSLQVHMYEFDATQSQFIFYPGFMSSNAFGTGAGLSTGTLPDFFEEVTDIGNEAEVTNADGEAVTSLGWKYLGHDLATVWQAVSHVYTFNFEWVYPSGNSDGTQNPPDVTSSLELVRLKPTGTDTYNMASNVTIIASSPTSFHNAGSLNPGDNETFTGSYEFAQQTLEDGISNVANGDVFAYRMKIRYKGNGFDGETNVRLAITESETTNFVPQLGIRHVGRDYSFVLEDSGDVQWTDHGSVDQTSILLLENTTDGIEIPAATLGLVAGDNITITGKTISSTDSQVLTAGDGIAIDSDAISIDFRTETNNPLEVSGTGDAAGLSLNIDEDGPLSKTTNGLDVTIETNGGLAIGSLSSGIEVLLPANSGLQTTATGLSLNAGINELTDVNIGTLADGQVLEYDGDTSMWINATASGNIAFTAGTGLSFNSDSTVLNTDGNSIEYSSFGVNTGDAVPTRNAGTTREIILGGNGIIGGESAIAIGTSTQALATSSIAIGLSARADAATSTALGGGARAFLTDATAIGRSASANGAQSTAVGANAATTGTDATALGTDSTAAGLRSIAVGQNSNASGTNTICIGNSSSASGVNAIHVGSAVTGTGDRSVVIGSAADASAAPLAIAVGERASVTATRGIAIGSSSNSASDSADRVQVTGANGIAIGRAARVVTAQGIAFGDDTRCLAADGTAIGASAQVSASATGSTAIGHNASATIANSTVLGSGTGHRVFAGSNELATIENRSGDITNIECSINNEFFGDGFNPSQTNSEILRYTQVGDLAIGRFDYKIATSTSTNFTEGDRWAISSTSTPMRDAFGYNVGTYGIALGTFVVAETAANSAAMGDMWLRNGSTETNISILFRVRSVIGTAPTRDSYISAQFNLAKF